MSSLVKSYHDALFGLPICHHMPAACQVEAEWSGENGLEVADAEMAHLKSRSVNDQKRVLRPARVQSLRG